jgi:CheY-like chemotaxis protein/GAF domain-containing protein
MQLERLGLLGLITRSSEQPEDLPGIYQAVIRSAEDSLPIDFGCVCLYDSGAEVLTVTSVGAASEGLALEMGLSEHARITHDLRVAARYDRGQLVYEPDIADVQFPFPQRLARGGMRALVAAPILVEGTVFGVVIAARRAPDSFSAAEREFLRQLSEIVALAVHQAEAHAVLQQAYDDLQHERMQALGQMAGGIAHDINNALSPAALYSQSLLEHDATLSAETRHDLTAILRSIESATDAVARMRELYSERQPSGEHRPVDLNLTHGTARALRILYVDDDPITLKWLSNALAKEGHDVLIAASGRHGIEVFHKAQLRGHHFDVVITDLGMPDIDGRKVAVAVKMASTSVPVILLTGRGHRMLAENDTPPNVDRVLGKPPKLAELRQAFAALVKDKAHGQSVDR